jgi:succinate dehydrogenase hydrophobic anchor subunit
VKETNLKILQYITGIGLFFLAGLHIVVIYLSSSEQTDWGMVSDRAASAGWLTFYILLLVFGLYHGIHGLRTIIIESRIPKPPARLLDWGLVIIGLAIFGYAVYIPINAFL